MMRNICIGPIDSENHFYHFINKKVQRVSASKE